MTDSCGLETTVRRCRIGLLATFVLAVMCAAANAQNNSVLHGQRRQAARPVAGGASTNDAQPLSPVAGVGVRSRGQVANDYDDEPPPNEVLVAVSPFGVEPPKPRKVLVNDLVTIIVRESRTSLSDAKMKSEKDWEMKSELSKWFRLDKDDHLVAQTFPSGATPGIDFTFENKYEGKGKYDRKDTLTTRITARVIDVKPNGNLVLEARKRVEVGEEVMTATLTGECRSVDVTAMNTVLSTQIADLEITLPDRGAVRDATRRGWLMRLFDLLRPI